MEDEKKKKTKCRLSQKRLEGRTKTRTNKQGD